MKKYLICLILVLTILVTGCSKKIKTYGRSDGIVISYRQSQSMSDNAIYKEVDLYNNKKVRFTYSNQDGFSEVTLSDEAYQEIIDYAFSSFMDLNKTLGKKEGYYEYITLYYDNTSFTVSGYDIEDEAYVKLENLLLNSREKEG